MNWLRRISILMVFLMTPTLAKATMRTYGGPDGVFASYTGSTRSASTIYWTFFHFDDLYPAYPNPGVFYAELSGTAGGRVSLALFQHYGGPYYVVGVSAPQTAVPGTMTFSLSLDPICLWIQDGFFTHLTQADYVVALYVESGLIGPKTTVGAPFNVTGVSVAPCQDPFSDLSFPSLTDWGLQFGVYMVGSQSGTITSTKTPSATSTISPTPGLTVCGVCPATQAPTSSITITATRTYRAACQGLSNTPTPTPTVTASASSLPTGSQTSTFTSTNTVAMPPTYTNTPSPTVTACPTVTATFTATATASVTATFTANLSVTVGPCLSCSVTVTSALVMTPPSGSFSYPAPANNSMTIAFNLPLAGRAKVEIYNLSGSLLGQIQADLGAGNQTLPVDLSAYAGGVYAYRLTEDLPSGTMVLPLQTFMIAKP